MKYSGLYKKRKWHRHSRIPLILLLISSIILAIIFYTIRYRFSTVLEYIVEKETGGRYAFYAKSMNISLLKKRIIMDEGEVICRDSSDENAHYNLAIPRIYFSIASWKELLFRKKIVIDSFSIINPQFSAYTVKADTAGRNRSFHPGDILTYLEETLEHLNARSLSIRNASLTYGRTDGSPPLQVQDFNLSVSNFTHVNNDDSHLFGSDNVEFSLGPQHWVFPDSSREISFKGLSFKSRNQKTEIDSFVYHQWSTDEKGVVDIRAEKFFFNSRHLPAIYQKSQLLIDTLFCLRPVFSIPGKSNSNPRQAIQKVAQTAEPLFQFVNIKFINIQEAALIQTDKEATASNSITSKTNLAIYNLTLDPTRKPQVTTDSIKLNVRQIHFYSADSLFKLDIGQFVFDRNDLIFKDVLFGPSEFNDNPKAMHFQAPLLVLHNIDLEELAHKRIAASSAELNEPEFTFEDTRKIRSGIAFRGSVTGKKTKGLYQILHGLPDLINVPEFNIYNGRFVYRATGGREARASGINIHLLPNKLLRIDSLIDVKAALPEFSLRQFNLTFGKLQARLFNFSFSGKQAENHSDSLDLLLPNGTRINGRSVYWHALDWDLLQRSKQLVTQAVRIGQFTAHITHNNPASPEKKDLPSISIGTVEIGKGNMLVESPKGDISFNLNRISLQHLASDKKQFTWDQAKFVLENFHQQTATTQTKIARFQFDNQSESILSGLSVVSETENARTRIALPTARLLLPLHGTDIKSLTISRLVLDNPQVDMVSLRQEKSPATSISIPADISLSELKWNNLKFTYQKTTGKDSLKLQFLCSAGGKHIQIFRNPEKIINYDRLNLHLRDLSIDRPGLSAALPDLELNLNPGDLVQQKDHRLNLTTGVDLAWKNANIQYKKDSALLSAPSVSGRFIETKFNFISGQKLEPAYLASAAQVQGNSLFYRNRQMHVRLGAYSWNGKKQELSLQHFEVMPNKSREESFKTAKWQKDYMELKGKQLTLTGIHFPDKRRDSILRVHRIEVEGLALGTWRDRRIPFEHGIEKPMPTKMINAISFPFAIDTVWLSKNEIHVHEYSIGTGLWSDIPIESLSGYVANLRNRDNRQAQLSVEASALFFRNPIQHFRYREAYGDSLSPFQASILLTQTNLRAFRELGMALAAVDIRSGHADTIDVGWSGNKYAATGDMHFMFEQLRIKMYDKKDTARQSFLQLLKTKLANLVLPGSKDANTFLYFERDREKFVFNYWVKTQAKGFLAAVGLKSSKKYLKEYNEKAAGFGLELIDPAALNGKRLTVNGKRYFSVNR